MQLYKMHLRFVQLRNGGRRRGGTARIQRPWRLAGEERKPMAASLVAEALSRIKAPWQVIPVYTCLTCLGRSRVVKERYGGLLDLGRVNRRLRGFSGGLVGSRRGLRIDGATVESERL